MFSLLLLSGPLAAQDTPPAAEPEGFSPQEYDIDRYQKLRGKSPFEFELAKPKVIDAADPFADLVLAGYAGSASRPTVYVVNTKTQERFTILPEGGSKKNTSGFKVISVNRGRNLATSTVKVEKDGQQKELSFDPKTLSSMTAGATGGQPGAGPGARPGIPGQPGQPMNRPGMVPGQPGVPGQAVKFQAPQAFVPGQSNRGGGAQQVNMAGGQATVAGVAGGQSPAAFVPGQAAVNGNAGAVVQAAAPQNQPITQDNTVRSVEQQQQINAMLDGKVPQAQPPRRRVVLPTSP